MPAGDGGGAAPAVEFAEERGAVGVEADDGAVDGVEGVVVAALLVLGLVVDDHRAIGRGLLDLHLAGGEVALEVLGVVGGVPEAPFHRARHIEGDGVAGGVAQAQAVDLAGGVQRHEAGELGLDAGLGGLKHGVAHAVAADVLVERGARGQERGREGELRSGVVGHVPLAVDGHEGDIPAARAVVLRHAVVTVAGQTQELGVAVEVVAARRVGDEAEEVLVAEVVDPRQWRGGGGDHILARLIVKVTVTHGPVSLFFPHVCRRRRRPRPRTAHL